MPIFDDATDVDGQPHSQSNRHRGFQRSRICQTLQLLSLALTNLLLGVVLHSSSLVTMAVPMPHWDMKSDFLRQVKDSPVWSTIRNFLLPPDILALRTAGPKWNHAELYGFFSALWFFLMENGKSTKDGN